MRRQAIVITAVLAGALLAGCSDSKGGEKATATTLTQSSAAVAVSAEALELGERLVINNVPSVYIRQDDTVGDTGPSDFAKAVRDDGGADAEAVLTQDGFIAGFQGYWTKEGGEIAVFLYQFENPAGAAHYLERIRASAKPADATTTVTEFAVTGVPGAKGYLTHTAEGDSVTVTFTRGVHATKIALTGADATATVANPIAREQYELLA